jgi:hypothetical protein
VQQRKGESLASLHKKDDTRKSGFWDNLTLSVSIVGHLSSPFNYYAVGRPAAMIGGFRQAEQRENLREVPLGGVGKGGEGAACSGQGIRMKN